MLPAQILFEGSLSPSRVVARGRGLSMRTQESSRTIGQHLVASVEEQAAVAELMEPSERLVGDAPLYEPPVSQLGILIIEL